MTNFEKIKSMDVDEFAKFLAGCGFPNSPCYVCPYDEGMHCISPVACSKEYQASIYKEWLEKEWW